MGHNLQLTIWSIPNRRKIRLVACLLNARGEQSHGALRLQRSIMPYSSLWISYSPLMKENHFNHVQRLLD
jgi:IS1 family transposase